MMTFNGNAVYAANTNVLAGGNLTASTEIFLNTGQVISGTQGYDLLTVNGTVTTPVLELSSVENGTKYGRAVLNTGGLISTGTLTVGGSGTTNAGDIIYFNGGTLQASAANATFFSNMGAAYVGGTSGSGGAIIDNDGHAITFTQSLLTGVGSLDPLSTAGSSAAVPRAGSTAA